jgi:F-type H+-transporting ATPase subunit epsilon
MHVVIAKVDEVYFDGEADSLTAPGEGGEMTVLHGHMPLVTTLKAGTLTVRVGEKEGTFPVLSGVMEVRRDGATVIL